MGTPFFLLFLILLRFLLVFLLGVVSFCHITYIASNICIVRVFSRESASCPHVPTA